MKIWIINQQMRLQLWRAKAKRAWLFLWNTRPSDLLMQATLGTVTIVVLLQLLVWLAPYLFGLSLVWGAFLLLLAIARCIANEVSR